MPDEKAVKSLPIILKRLHERFPDARYELNWDNPLQLVVATILAAQCTDERVNAVTPGLFKKYPSAKAFADADAPGLEEDLKPTGFYRQKAKTVQAVCRSLVERFGGEVPRTMEEMVTLPGIGRKTANVILNTAFQMPTGIIVDTHVLRVAPRMGLTDQKNPEKIEQDLMRLVPKDEWVFFGPAMVLLGRYICTFHSPQCDSCIMKDLCPKRGVGEEDAEADETAEPEEEAPAMAAKKTSSSSKKKPAPAKKAAAPAKKAAPASNGAAEAPSLRNMLPADWQAALADEFAKPYFRQLEKFVAAERASQTVYPPPEDMFSAFKATPFDSVKVLLLGQDPYHGAGEAHGMCFSVKPGVKVPPSLVTIYKELQDDLGFAPPPHGHLASWAAQGVLLLNSVLTVRANAANSHKDQGWETFTDAVIKALGTRARPTVFLLWGNAAKEKAALIDQTKHRILTAAHPSPLSQKKFLGSKPFSGANKALAELGQPTINWQIPADPNATANATAAPAAPAPAKAAAPTVPSAPFVVTTAQPTPAPAPAPAAEATALEKMLPAEWHKLLAEECRKASFRNLDKFLAGDRQDNVVCPAEADVFAALRLTPPERVRVVLLGAEPPAASDLADGLAFSVREGADISAQQMALFRSLRESLGCRIPTTGSLESWARGGVLLLNSVLTVREGRPGSHAGKGWEAFTDAVLKAVSAGKEPAVFILLGQAAWKKRSLIDAERHGIIQAESPAISPDKFIDASVFQRANDELEQRGQSGVYWQLPYA